VNGEAVRIKPHRRIGGRVGLKGSDGLDVQQQARALGAKPQAQERTAATLKALQPLIEDIELLTAPGMMGETVAYHCGFALRVISTPGLSAETRGFTTVDDTRHAAQVMRDAGVDLILFTGGDGTARDMYEAIGNDFPFLVSSRCKDPLCGLRHYTL
jgi:predicted polyphosphate/ATP-dependent NAD kinase